MRTPAEATERALAYMGLTRICLITEITIDKVFIGSCTNHGSKIFAWPQA